MKRPPKSKEEVFHAALVGAAGHALQAWAKMKVAYESKESTTKPPSAAELASQLVYCAEQIAVNAVERARRIAEEEGVP